MNRPDVLILMSTFNGAKYLREQLDSIFSQQNVKIHLLIRDDGSTDNTVDIIDDFSLKYPGTVSLTKGENIGWKASFFQLISYAAENEIHYDYIAFSDQDDIWLPDKLWQAIECLDTLPEGPQLYCSNLIYYKDGIEMGLVKKQMLDNTCKGALIRNYATGCTILFNRALLLLLAKARPDYDVPHDYWAYLVASMCGSVYTDSHAYILYRQHTDNQIGSQRKWKDVWLRRLKTPSSLLKCGGKDRMAHDLIKIYSKEMSPEASIAASRLAEYKKSLLNRLVVLFDKGYTYNSLSNDFWLRLRILSGRL